jgi:transposase-like protein
MQRRIKAETKMLILREHLENKVPMADLAEKYHVNVNSIMNWKRNVPVPEHGHRRLLAVYRPP